MSRRLLALLGFVAATHLRGAERIEHANGLYHVYRIDKADLAKLDLRWLGDNGKPLMSFDGLRAQLAREKQTIAFATNAGIYERGPKPLGLTISGGKELVPLNLQKGEGNFYLKPNGVFFVDAARGAGVMEAAEFAKAGLTPRLATQSGDPISKNRRQRSGVGIRAADGQVIFVVSDRNIGPKGSVRFHQFASFFLHLGCRDALFLDGDLSDMITDPPAGAALPSNTYAAMFVIAQ
jgi:uncharacterized protein YigE (DUF2233 family)